MAKVDCPELTGSIPTSTQHQEVAVASEPTEIKPSRRSGEKLEGRPKAEKWDGCGIPMHSRYRAVTRLKFCVNSSLLRASGKRDVLTHPKRERPTWRGVLHGL